jgi:hypothetical protein
MPKVSESADLSGYAPVATRISAFYERYPDGRIITQLWERTREEVVFRALVYRYQGDSKPASTGWASEREGDGDINLVACVENTETSAIGRALANLGFTASLHRASAEEMVKASRARVRSLPRAEGSQPRLEPEARERIVADLLRLIQRAAHAGVRPARARRWRASLLSKRYPERELARMEQRLRRWIAERGRVAAG